MLDTKKIVVDFKKKAVAYSKEALKKTGIKGKPAELKPVIESMSGDYLNGVAAVFEMFGDEKQRDVLLQIIVDGTTNPALCRGLAQELRRAV